AAFRAWACASVAVNGISAAIRLMRPFCCARAKCGHVVAPTKSVMNSRRRIVTPDARMTHGTELHQRERVKSPLSPTDVRFGSKADICNAKRHVRFTPESNIKCDIWNVRFGPKADMANLTQSLRRRGRAALAAR